MTYGELWDRVQAIALGLIDLGVDVGDRVGIARATPASSSRSPTSPRRSAGAVVVPVYPTNSADECEWVRRRLRRHARRLRERRPGRPRSTRSAPTCPTLQHIVDHRRRGAGRAADWPTSRPRGAGGDPSELARRAAAVGPTTPA